MTDNTLTVCDQCDGTGRFYYMQGGPYGIGQWGKCDRCKGTGQVNDGS